MLLLALIIIGHASESLSGSWDLADFHQNWAQGLASDGNVLWWFSGDGSNDGLHKINFETGEITSTFHMISTCNDPQGLTFDGSGNLLFVCFADDKVYKLNPSNGAILKVWRTGGSKPIGITYVPEDNQFIISDEDGKIYIHNDSGALVANKTAPWGSRTANIHYVKEDGVGYLYVTLYFESTIKKYRYPSLSLSASFDAPSPWLKGVSIDGTYIYVSDTKGGVMRKPFSQLGQGCKNTVTVIPLW